MRFLRSQRARHSLVIGIAALGLAVLFAQTSLFRHLSWWVEDAQHRALGPVLDMGDALVVDVDEQSLEQLQDSLGAWPYPRGVFARVTRYLLERDARTVAFDILFAEPRAGDEEFAAVLDERVIVAAAALPRPPARSEAYLRQLSRASLPQLLSRSSLQPQSNSSPAQSALPTYHWPDITLPIPALTELGRARVGVISVRPDEDGTLRRVPTLHEAYGSVLPSFVLASWIRASEIGPVLQDGRTVRFGPRSLPVNEDGEVLLRYPRQLRNLTVLPFHRLVSAAGGGAEATALDPIVRGKIVFIGSSGTLLGDYALTPLGRVSGLLLAAIVQQSMAAGQVMRPVAGWGQMLLIALALAPTLICSWREKFSRLKPFIVAFLATILLVVPIGLVLFHFGLKLNWLLALACGLFAQVMALGFGFFHLYMEQQRLSYERQLAEKANRLKSEFLTHMAHELRTPLTAIMGFNKINQLDDRLGRSKRIEHSEIIARNCDHLLKLVNDNLDHAKIEAGQMRVILGAESIEEMVDDVVSTLRPIATGKGLFLEARFERPLPDALLIDAFRVRQVLLNLVGNALKFTQVGRIDILVRWRERRLAVSVTDTGPGIEKGASARIFEAFQQGEADSAVKHAGTGLGLSIARSLVRLMGGDIELESWPGQGSRFHFWLPAQETARAVRSSTQDSVPKTYALAGKILLAEDDEDIGNLMQRELTALGLQVHVVHNGLEAVRAAHLTDFDLVLMDLEMPIMSGLEAVQVLRAEGFRQPIVALTAHTQGPETEAALAQGCTSVVSKPVSSEVLGEKLGAHLSARKRMDASCVTSVHGQ